MAFISKAILESSLKLKKNRYALKESSDPVPSFKDVELLQGRVKLKACIGLRSLDLYKNSISKVGVFFINYYLQTCCTVTWKEAKLEVVSRDDISTIM